MLRFKKIGLKVFYETSDSEVIQIIEKSLSFSVEGAHFSSLVQEGHWDGIARFYDAKKKWFWHGLIGLVEKKLDKRQMPYKKYGFDWNSTDWIKFSSKLLADERDYQRNAVKDFIRVGSGIIKVPTRGGKTFIASEIIRLLLGTQRVSSALFIVDNVDLFKQATKDISAFLKVDIKDIGQIRESKVVIKPVTIATIQTIQTILYGKKNMLSKEKRQRKSQLEKYLKSVELPIIDEIHEYGSSRARMNILRKFIDYKWYLGITATDKKLSKIPNINIVSVTGGVVYDIPEEELVKKKVLADNRILLLYFKHDLKHFKDSLSYSDINTQLIIKNPRRNLVITYFLQAASDLGLKTIAMFNSVIHGKAISESTGFTFISGESKDKVRETIKEEFLSKSGGVLLVSDIWKKGITLPSVEMLLNADGGKEPSLVIQRRGRILGVTEDKTKALYVDFVDDSEHYLGEHSDMRLKAYQEKLSKNKIDVLDTSSIDFFRHIKEYLIEFFELDIQE